MGAFREIFPSRIGLFGLGKSNLGVAEYLISKNPRLDITLRCDDMPNEALLSSVPHIRAFFGAGSKDEIDEEILFLSPTVRRDLPELIESKKRGVILSSDAELFFESFSGNVISVTGSDGKSTCTYLISKILSLAGYNSCPAGNFGKSLSTLINEDVFVCAELSSFQLMYMTPKSIRAVITNISENHLNWHKDFSEYCSAKLNIAKCCEALITDADCDTTQALTKELPSFARVSLKRSFPELKSLYKSENYLTYDGDNILLNGEKYICLKDVVRRENYNIKNYLLSAAATLGIAPPDAMKEAFSSFMGLTHRAELVRISDGIKYINSSIDTSPKRCERTLLSLTGDIAIILGGSDKGISQDSLIPTLKERTCGAALMGEVGKRIKELLDKDSSLSHYTYRLVDNMGEAVAFARSLLQGSGTVLLSPAATSFDCYKNFEERGEDFRRICLSL